jgi:hypothetical protein
MIGFTDALFYLVAGAAVGYLLCDLLRYRRRRRERLELDRVIHRVVALPHDIQTVDPPPITTPTDTEPRNRICRPTAGADDGRR